MQLPGEKGGRKDLPKEEQSWKKAERGWAFPIASTLGS